MQGWPQILGCLMKIQMGRGCVSFLLPLVVGPYMLHHATMDCSPVPTYVGVRLIDYNITFLNKYAWDWAHSEHMIKQMY